jgi:CRISPR-associated protein Cmr5
MIAKQTTSQRMAQSAYERTKREQSEDYLSFARSFPALIHTCGLAQAVVFAQAKGQKVYLADLAAVLHSVGRIGDEGDLDHEARTASASAYVQISRDALKAASWLKRYAEVVSKV